jgi:hypothetical protein
MIWFSCKQCGKVHGRPENSIGTTIFCECGQGLLVPWESTAPEPETPIPVLAKPPPLKLDPVTFDPVPSRAAPPPLTRPEPSPRRRPRLGPRDPRFCFNHEDLPQQTACADCGEFFCANCLVTFQGKSLCGPCKNFRVRVLLKPSPTSRLALTSALLAFLPGFFLIPLGYFSGSPILGFLAMVPQIVALVLGILALRQAERDPHIEGRSLAFTGVIGAAVTSLLIILLAIYAPRGGM